MLPKPASSPTTTWPRSGAFSPWGRGTPRSPENRPLLISAVTRIRPVLSGLIVGAIAAALVGHALARGPFASDLDQLWIAGRALLGGSDPYAAVARAHINLGYPLYYPLPAVILTLPLALMPLAAARLVFAIACGFLAGFGVES